MTITSMFGAVDRNELAYNPQKELDGMPRRDVVWLALASRLQGLRAGC
jgi:hypothetical protein